MEFQVWQTLEALLTIKIQEIINKDIEMEGNKIQTM